MTLTFKTAGLLVLLLAALTFTLATSRPLRGSARLRVRRQSFFRCSGWGAGCSNLEHKHWRPHASYTLPPQPLPPIPRLSSGSRLLYGPPYFFTSGASWGAIGKRKEGSAYPPASPVYPWASQRDRPVYPSEKSERPPVRQRDRPERLLQLSLQYLASDALDSAPWM